MLILAHPEVAGRDCGDCQKFVYDEKTGQRSVRGGLPILRPKSTKPPCGYGPDRCAKGNPTAGRDLSLHNWQAWQHYLECRATGNFPDDRIVARNARIISSVESMVGGG